MILVVIVFVLYGLVNLPPAIDEYRRNKKIKEQKK